MSEIKVIAEVGGLPDEVRVTLALYATDLDPDAVSARMGCAPSRAHKKGDAMGIRSLPFRQGAWLLTVEGSQPADADQLASELLQRFPETAEFWAGLRRDFDVRITFGIHTVGWNRGFDFRPETVARLAATGAPVGFDLYFDGDDD